MCMENIPMNLNKTRSTQSRLTLRFLLCVFLLDIPVKLGRGMLLHAMQQQPHPGAHTATPSPSNQPRVVGTDTTPPTQALRGMNISGKPSTVGHSSSSPTAPTHQPSMPKQRGSAGSKYVTVVIVTGTKGPTFLFCLLFFLIEFH